jgi:NAD(P)-dependent dehydrogenase (short-subunit alcohol dehydrogenase family)
MTVSVDLAGRRVLVVGASAGIGRGIALAAAKAGARIAIVGRRLAQLEDVLSEVPDGVAIRADVSDEDESRQAVETAVARLGGLDAVLFPVGVSLLRMLAGSDRETWMTALATNVVAPALMTSAALPSVPPGGVFLYVSSENVARPAHGLGAYGASKAALEHSIRTWRIEHPDHRFMRLTVGATTPTDISKNFSIETISECLPLWQTSGLVPAQFMHTDDVGRATVELLALALAHPNIGVTDVEFTPPGRPISATEVTELVTQGRTGTQNGEGSQAGDATAP